MMKRLRLAVLCMSIAALVLALTQGPLRATLAGRDRRTADAQVHPLAFFDRRTFVQALARTAAAPPKTAEGVRAVIVPHHWLAADLIVDGLRGLGDGRDVRRVVLVGPNHTGAGGAPFSTSRLSWRVPDGIIRPDAEGLRAILTHPETRVKPDVMSHEHSVAGLVPAVSHFFPRATVVPIAVRARTDAIALRRMARTLAGLLQDPATIVVASVDFSHYRSASEAIRRNRESIQAIAAFDVGRILRFGNEHMDSPPTIALLLETMRLVGAGRFDLWADRTSADFGGPSTAPNVTSYVVGAFH